MEKYLYKLMSKILTVYDMKINHCRNAHICQKIVELDIACK